MNSVETFKARVAEVESQDTYQVPAAFALGLAHYGITDYKNLSTWSESSKVLDTYYPTVNVNENAGSAAIFADICNHQSGSQTYVLSGDQISEAIAAFSPFADDGKKHANIEALHALQAALDLGDCATAKPMRIVACFIEDLQKPAVSAYDAYLRLHNLSHRKQQPHEQNMDGLFGQLNNVVWTNYGPYDPDNFEMIRAQLLAQNIAIDVHSIDKFPRMTDYVIPGGVRIADADRVRLGAHLAEGTTIMHEGFVNFNAGTLGNSMVEGRISAGVVVGDGSDVGGGASIMGTLSGGGSEVISVGEGCLLGANSGLGVSLGDNCTIEAGLYVTGGSKVLCSWDSKTRKAKELSGKNELLFRRNSISGALEVLQKRNEVVLNEALHSND
ncbi:MAG: tetrahydrodipicolinate N-succinyltransferase N-terminal domain-containing protein [Planctomycetes bacterium]|nr:tetrahydrodipicolinate N-succinyltransferase N-terminal domain-containing protein [Planctomycetota bacterium]